jgi:hypothetical protein
MTKLTLNLSVLTKTGLPIDIQKFGKNVKKTTVIKKNCGEFL